MRVSCTVLLSTVVSLVSADCSRYATISTCLGDVSCEWSIHNFCQTSPSSKCTLRTLAECEADSLCQWKDSQCTRVVRDFTVQSAVECSQIAFVDECNNNMGCLWSHSTQSCESSAASICHLATRAECEADSFCQWKDSQCTPIVRDFTVQSAAKCSQISSEDECNTVQGCVWSLSTHNCQSQSSSSSHCASASRAECEADSLCQWNGSKCTRVSRQFAVQSEVKCSQIAFVDECNNNMGCLWSHSTQSCESSAASICHLATRAECEADSFCQWKDSQCTPIVRDFTVQSAVMCSQISSEDVCIIAQGCVWSRSTLTCESWTA